MATVNREDLNSQMFLLREKNVFCEENAMCSALCAILRGGDLACVQCYVGEILRARLTGKI